MRFSVHFLCAASAAALLAASPASAQRVGRVVAFGDSYTDDGNFFELTGIPRPAVYANGRFSNGTNFVDTIGTILGRPIQNFAIGGAFTGPGNTGFTNINGPGILGFPTEYQSFLAGGGPAAFPRTTGRFAADDLVVISIGGNDARFYEQALGRNLTSAQIASRIAGAPAAANISVAEATVGLNALVGAGARNITFLAGDVGRLPEVAGTPIAAIGTAFANQFNTGIQGSLSTIASRGVIVNYLDLNKIGDVVGANLSAFGLISAGACPIACVTTDPTLLDKYLFYVDQVHLTSRGFEIVGQYAVRQLEAPLHFQAQTDIGLETARAFGSTLLGRLDLSDARSGAGGNGGGLQFYVTGSFAGRDYGAGNTNLPYDLDVTGVTAGAEYDMGSGAMIGIAGNYSMAEADIITSNGGAEAQAWQVGIYGAWAGAGGAFLEGYAGYGWLQHENERDAVIDEIEGEADGDAIIAGAKAGYLFGLGGFRVGPVVGVQYAKAELDGYTEQGDPVLTLNVEEQELKALVGQAGIEARGEMDWAGLSFAPYVTLTAERDFEGDGRVIRYAGTASPTIVNSFVLADRPKDTYARLTGGATLALAERIKLQINGSSSFSRAGGDDFSGLVGIKVGF